MTMPDVIALVPVDWHVAPDNPMELGSYRRCDLCQEDGCDDIWNHKEIRQFYQERIGQSGGINVCEHCLEAYLKEKP